MPWKVGTMTDSSLVSGKPPRLANPGVVIASTARKKVTIGCKETLSPELQELSDQQDREQEEQKKRSLNPKGAWERREATPLHP